MSVGQELAKITGLKLLHNHMSIELVSEFFSAHESEEGRQLDTQIRSDIFEAVANSNLPGLIFTMVFNFDNPFEYVYVSRLTENFELHKAKILFVELYANCDIRAKRNQTPNRLAHKPSKRAEDAQKKFNYVETLGRYSSYNDEKLFFKNYIKIDNTDLLPEEVAGMIKQKLLHL